jgi:membrane-associated PAP2 superfamily phosphatase
VNQFSNYIGLSPERKYKDVIKFNLGSTAINAYQAPQNLNSVLYSIGEGSTSVLLCAGLFTYGKIKNDYRAIQTSNQLMQTLFAVGVTTQILKRISGRQSPFASTVAGGKWRPLPNLGTYQDKVSSYDAFPSGHMATMMATLVVIKDNYPEKKWIGPVGYGLISVVGLAMVNNQVHWMSDYPLALGIGYVFGKVTVKMNRWVKGEKPRKATRF